METKSICLNFRVQYRDKQKDVQVDTLIFDAFVDSLATSFAKQKNWYRFGSSSGAIIIEGITFGELRTLMDNIKGVNELVDNIFLLNPQLGEDGITDIKQMDLLSLYYYIMEEHEDRIHKAILKENGMESLPKARPLSTPTYEFEGKQVVFFGFYQACHDETEWYAVPVEEAQRLNLEDYDGEEISRWADFLNDISDYEIQEDFIFKGSYIKAFNYD